jgi:hypothetical protein
VHQSQQDPAKAWPIRIATSGRLRFERGAIGGLPHIAALASKMFLPGANARDLLDLVGQHQNFNNGNANVQVPL